MKLILPNTRLRDESDIKPLLFLAGPIKGGSNWQHTACLYLAQQDRPVTVAVPCTWDAKHPMSIYRVAGVEEAFASQTLWERYYMQRAAHWGCLVFWLPCESATDPRLDGPYARDTYGELGAWRNHLAFDSSIRIAIGAEPEFPGLSVLRCNLNQDAGYEFPVYSTLEETLDAALTVRRAPLMEDLTF